MSITERTSAKRDTRPRKTPTSSPGGDAVHIVLFTACEQATVDQNAPVAMHALHVTVTSDANSGPADVRSTGKGRLHATLRITRGGMRVDARPSIQAFVNGARNSDCDADDKTVFPYRWKCTYGSTFTTWYALHMERTLRRTRIRRRV